MYESGVGKCRNTFQPLTTEDPGRINHGYFQAYRAHDGANDMNAGMLQRPIFGGLFGFGRYALATLPVITNGLHAVKYLVIEQQQGIVLSIAEGKQQALQAARKLLQASNDEEAQEQVWQQASLWGTEDAPPEKLVTVEQTKPISRRRRDIFEKSGGRCHYCSRTLTLDGKWHVEHMLPKALEGADDALNLVAACVPCNLAKSDRTAVEFVAMLNRLPNRTAAANSA